MNKLASLTIAYNEEDIIGGCLELLDIEYKLVIIPRKTFSGKNIVKFDNTEEIAKEKGAVVLFTDTQTEPEARNFGLRFLNNIGYEYALIIDADEYWTLETQKEMRRIINENPADCYKANLDFFFKNPNWKIENMPNRKAIIAIRTDKEFSSRRPRRFDGKSLFINPGIIYHFSYVRSQEKIKEKLASFSHSHQIIENWFNDVYLPFNLKSKDFHPVNPKEYPSCVVCELPEEIKNKFL